MTIPNTHKKNFIKRSNSFIFLNNLCLSRNGRFWLKTRPPQRNSVAFHRAGTKVSTGGEAPPVRDGERGIGTKDAMSGWTQPHYIRMKFFVKGGGENMTLTTYYNLGTFLKQSSLRL